MKEQQVAAPESAAPAVMLAHFGGETKTAAVQLVYLLRNAGIGARLAFARTRRSLKSQMREANKHNVRFVLIMGESEVAEKTVTVRPLDGGDQIQIPQSELVDWLKENLNS
jgi:histidyl-tRNA synthetase